MPNFSYPARRSADAASVNIRPPGCKEYSVHNRFSFQRIGAPARVRKVESLASSYA